MCIVIIKKLFPFSLQINYCVCFFRITSASINGTKYTPTQVVCFDIESVTNEPLFGVIIDLLVARTVCFTTIEYGLSIYMWKK